MNYKDNNGNTVKVDGTLDEFIASLGNFWIKESI